MKIAIESKLLKEGIVLEDRIVRVEKLWVRAKELRRLGNFFV